MNKWDELLSNLEHINSQLLEDRHSVRGLGEMTLNQAKSAIKTFRTTRVLAGRVLNEIESIQTVIQNDT